MKKRFITSILMLGMCLFTSLNVHAEDSINGNLTDYTELLEDQRPEDVEPLLVEQNSYLRTTSTQQVINLSILVEFDEDKGGTAAVDFTDANLQTAMYAVMNGSDSISNNVFDTMNQYQTTSIPILSLSEYVDTYSYGSLNITSEFFPKTDELAITPYIDTNDRSYYLNEDTVNSEAGYVGDDERWEREYELIDNALKAAEESIMKMYTTEQLDSNGDGYIDSLTFFVETPDGDDIAWMDLLWAHKAVRGEGSPTICGLEIDTYTLMCVEPNDAAGGNIFSYTVDEDDTFALNEANYGVVIHEFLHTLGVPDLYRSNTYSGTPVGYYDIMSTQNETYPQRPTAATLVQLGFLDEITSISTDQTVVLESADFESTDENFAYIIQLPTSQSEYFVVEYYEADEWNVKAGYQADYDGIIIYRIISSKADEGNINSDGSGIADYMYIFRPDEYDVLNGWGSIGEAPMELEVGTSYGQTLEESSGAWENTTLYYSDGNNSGIELTITEVSEGQVSLYIDVPEFEGEGTEESPYLIDSIETFYACANFGDDSYMELTNDIDFLGTLRSPITEFYGHLDGNNYTISNLNIQGDGLFYSILGGSIKNLNIDNIQVYPDISYGGDIGQGSPDLSNTESDEWGDMVSDDDEGTILTSYTGTIAGGISMGGQLINVHVTNATVTSGFMGAGGLVGSIGEFEAQDYDSADDDIEIQNCSTDAVITGEGAIGGFAGFASFASGTIEDSYTTATILAEETGTCGGFFGSSSSEALAISNCGFDIIKSNQNTALPEDESAEGITGFAMEASYELDLNGVKTIDCNTLASPEKEIGDMIEVEFQDTSVAIYDEQNNQIIGTKVGSTTAIVSLTFYEGSKPMVLTSEITVVDTSEPDDTVGDAGESEGNVDKDSDAEDGDVEDGDAESGDVADTGDYTPISLYMLLMILGIVGINFMYWRGRNELV